MVKCKAMKYLLWMVVMGLASAGRGGETPKPIPAGFDCKARHLAMEFATKIQPFRPRASLGIMAEVLNAPGGLPGGATQCFNTTVPADAPKDFSPKFPIKPLQTTFYVATDGDDGHDGTKQKPFATISKAIEATRGTEGKATILLRKGTHYLAKTITLNHEDSGLTIQNYDGEKVWISGAKRLTPKWTSAGNNIWKSDVPGIKEMTGLRFDQKRAVRARYPNGCTTDKPLPSGYMCQGNITGGRVVDPNDGFGSDLLTDWVLPDEIPKMSQPDRLDFHPPTPSRLDGKSFQTFQIGIGGSCADAGFVPPAGYWCGNACDGGAPKPPDCIARWPKGLVYDKKRLPNAPYNDPSTAVVQAWHPGHWASWMFQVSKHSNDTHLMFTKGGFQGARGSYAGSTAASAFFVENVFEELDMDNEFFYDAKKEILYYYSSSGIPQAKLVEATSLKTFISMKGTQQMPVRDIHILGVNFRDSALTYLDDHCMPSGGDWGLGRIAGISAYGVSGVTIDSCTFEKLDGNAILINGYARDVVIQNNDFHEIGDNMVALLGETEGAGEIAWGMGWDGTAGNQPRGTIVKNNFAYRCGLFEKQSSFFFQAKAMATRVENNIFFHGPRAGMNFNDGFGGGNVVANNLMFSTVMESGDHGPFNSWDRQPYAYEHNPDGTPNLRKSYDEIVGNFFIGNYYGQEAIDNDDGSAYFKTHHNLFVYAHNGMKNDFNGHDNHHHDNIYAFGMTGMGICGALPGHADQFYNNTVIQRVTGGYASYDCNCWRDGSCPLLHDNKIYTHNGAMGPVCGEELSKRQRDGVDLGTKVYPWPADEDIIKWAREILPALQSVIIS